MANKNPLLNGITDLLILKILSNNDDYAYNMRKIIMEAIQDNFTVSLNTIYTSIYKLENQKYISEYSKLVGKKRTRIYYHIEPSGLELLSEIEKQYKAITTGVSLFLEQFD